MRISDWSSDVCSSDLGHHRARQRQDGGGDPAGSRACHPVAVRRGGITVTEGGLSSPSKGEQERARSVAPGQVPADWSRSEEHTSELQSLMRIPYAVFCLTKKQQKLRTQPIRRSSNATNRNITTTAKHTDLKYNIE